MLSGNTKQSTDNYRTVKLFLFSAFPPPPPQYSPTPPPQPSLDDVNLQYLKELETEKESLEEVSDDSVKKSQALKLLEQGNDVKIK